MQRTVGLYVEAIWPLTIRDQSVIFRTFGENHGTAARGRSCNVDYVFPRRENCFGWTPNKAHSDSFALDLALISKLCWRPANSFQNFLYRTRGPSGEKHSNDQHLRWSTRLCHWSSIRCRHSIDCAPDPGPSCGALWDHHHGISKDPRKAQGSLRENPFLCSGDLFAPMEAVLSNRS